MGTYYIKHRFKDKIVIPSQAIVNNFDFFFIDKDEEKNVITIDNIKARIESIKEENIFELEKDIKEIYKISLIDFLKKWYEADRIESLIFYKLELKKYDN